MDEPEHTIVIDFETYYDQDYSLTKMPTAHYVLDRRFLILGYAYKLDDNPIVWGTLPYPTLNDLPWENATCVAHNAMFDGLILEGQLSIHPARYFCTSMAARPCVHPHIGSTRLADVAEYFGVGVKGDEAVKAKGKHRGDFTPEEWLAYMNYCKNDVALCHNIYHVLTAWYERHNVNVS